MSTRMASATSRSGVSSSVRSATAKGSSSASMYSRPMRLTTRTRPPFRVSTMAAPRPGVPGGKFAGRTSRGWRSMKTSASRWSQEWLPSVTASAPAIRISSQIASVMPKPPAAFSPLMTTQSSRQRSRSAGSRSATALRPGRPTMSPRKRRRIQRGSLRSHLRMRRSQDERSDHFRFRHDEVKHPVMILCRHGLDLLRRISKPDGQHRMHLRQSRNRAVEMALAVADAVALAVEGGKRHEQRHREAPRRIGPGLADAEAALDQRVARAPQAPAQARVQDLRQRHVLAAPEQGAHQRARVDLAADRPIAADRLDVRELRKLERALGDGAGGVAAENPVE